MVRRGTRKTRRNNMRTSIQRQNATRRLLPRLNNGSKIVRNWMMGKTTPREIAQANRALRMTYVVNPTMPAHIKNQVLNALNRFGRTGSVY